VAITPQWYQILVFGKKLKPTWYQFGNVSKTHLLPIYNTHFLCKRVKFWNTQPHTHINPLGIHQGLLWYKMFYAITFSPTISICIYQNQVSIFLKIKIKKS
jgi:hypothetical protein